MKENVKASTIQNNSEQVDQFDLSSQEIKSNKGAIGLVVAIAAVILLIGVVSYVFMSQDGGEVVDSTPTPTTERTVAQDTATPISTPTPEVKVVDVSSWIDADIHPENFYSIKLPPTWVKTSQGGQLIYKDPSSGIVWSVGTNMNATKIEQIDQQVTSNNRILEVGYRNTVAGNRAVFYAYPDKHDDAYRLYVVVEDLKWQFLSSGCKDGLLYIYITIPNDLLVLEDTIDKIVYPMISTIVLNPNCTW